MMRNNQLGEITWESLKQSYYNLWELRAQQAKDELAREQANLVRALKERDDALAKLANSEAELAREKVELVQAQAFALQTSTEAAAAKLETERQQAELDLLQLGTEFRKIIEPHLQSITNRMKELKNIIEMFNTSSLGTTNTEIQTIQKLLDTNQIGLAFQRFKALMGTIPTLKSSPTPADALQQYQNIESDMKEVAIRFAANEQCLHPDAAIRKTRTSIDTALPPMKKACEDMALNRDKILNLMIVLTKRITGLAQSLKENLPKREEEKKSPSITPVSKPAAPTIIPRMPLQPLSAPSSNSSSPSLSAGSNPPSPPSSGSLSPSSPSYSQANHRSSLINQFQGMVVDNAAIDDNQPGLSPAYR